MSIRGHRPELQSGPPRAAARPLLPARMGRMVEMTRAEFEDAVRDALDEIPDELAAMMDNVVVLVEDSPPADEPDLLGLYEGTPLTERGDFWAVGVAARPHHDLPAADARLLRGPRRGGRGGRGDGRARDRAPLRHRRRAAARPRLGLIAVGHDHDHSTAAQAHRGRLLGRARPDAGRARRRGRRRRRVGVVRAGRRRGAHAHRRGRGRPGARCDRAGACGPRPPPGRSGGSAPRSSPRW